MEHEFKEFTAKTSEEAIAIGLQETGLSKEDALIVVLEEGKKKLFGWHNARVKIAAKNAPILNENKPVEEVIESAPKTAKKPQRKPLKTGETDGERTVKFLDGLFAVLEMDAETELKEEGEKIVVNVTAKKGSEVIGRRGEVLDAVQTLASAVANTGRDDYLRVVVDCEDYRERREETLKKLANNLAEKANRLGRKIKLEPMNPYERRIIHAALNERNDVKTKSEGKEPDRYIVIIPENDSDLPPLPARDERRAGGNRRGDRRDRGGRGDRRDRGDRGGRGGNGRQRSSGGKKPTNFDFFGTFLGNSGNKHED